LRSTVGRGRDNSLIRLGRHVLRDRAGHTSTLGLVVVVVRLLRGLEAGHVLELGIIEGSRGSGLEGAAKEELGGKERSELHVEAGSGGRHVILNRGWRRGLGLVHGLSVELGDVATARVTVISKARHVGGEGAMGETSIAVGGLGRVAEAVTTRGRVVRALRVGAVEVVLHVEEMRGDVRVPPGVRQYSRFERLDVPGERHGGIESKDKLLDRLHREPCTAKKLWVMAFELRLIATRVEWTRYQNKSTVQGVLSKYIVDKRHGLDVQLVRIERRSEVVEVELANV
jgi:hypothetical protein